MEQDVKDFIESTATAAANKAAEEAVSKVFARYELEAKHMVFIKDSYDRNLQVVGLVRKSLLVALIVGVIGWTAAGFLMDVSEKTKSVITPKKVASSE